MSAVRSSRSAWLLAGMGVAACGGDGERVAALDPDAGQVAGDASAADASVPWTTGRCTRDADDGEVVAQLGLSLADPVAVTARDDGATLVWTTLMGGKRRVQTRWLGAGGEIHGAVLSEDASDQATPAATATGSGFLTVWTDDGAGAARLRARPTSALGEASGLAATVLTTDANGNHHPSLARGADGNVLVAWIADAPTPRGRTLLVNAEAAALASAHDLPELQASSSAPAVAALGTGYVVAWVDRGARRVHVQRIDGSGAPVGASSVVDTEGIAHGNLSVATHDQGGGIAFDVLVSGSRPEVRFRAFDQAAVPTGPEQAITSGPASGLRPVMVAMRGGFAIAYRHSEPGGLNLQLALRNARGEHVASAPIVPLQAIDLPLDLAVNPSGTRLLLAWLDAQPGVEGHQLQRTWIHCE